MGLISKVEIIRDSLCGWFGYAELLNLFFVVAVQNTIIVTIMPNAHLCLHTLCHTTGLVPTGILSVVSKELFIA